MKPRLSAVLAVALVCLLGLLFCHARFLFAEPLVGVDADWPCWRGPARNGIAVGEEPPLDFAEDGSVLWKTPIPGRGHGSPVVAGEYVFIATADEASQRQILICFDRATGKTLWETNVHTGKFFKKINKKASHASSTPACDGERVYINFANDGAAFSSALDLSGKLLWQTKLSNYIVHQGYASSPAIYGPLLIVSADTKVKGGGAVAGLNRETGDVVWRQSRPNKPNYASPAIHTVAGKEQLLFTGCDKVSSYDPLTGKKLWEIAGATTECVTTAVTDGQHVFTSGGYPKNHVSAIVGDGSGKEAWSNNVRVYVPSMLVKSGYLYAVADAGIAICWECATGKTMWKQRLGGTFSSSPIMINDKLLAINEAGTAFTFTATPEKFQLVHKANFGDEVFATPAICSGRLYARTTVKSDGKRQDWLYCFGKK